MVDAHSAWLCVLVVRWAGAPLPDGWGFAYDQQGRVYFLNHKVITCSDTREGRGGGGLCQAASYGRMGWLLACAAGANHDVRGPAWQVLSEKFGTYLHACDDQRVVVPVVDAAAALR